MKTSTGDSKFEMCILDSKAVFNLLRKFPFAHCGISIVFVSTATFVDAFRMHALQLLYHENVFEDVNKRT